MALNFRRRSRVLAILTSLSVVGTMTTTVAVESQEVDPSRLSRYKANEPWALVGPEVKNPEYRTEDFPRSAYCGNGGSQYS